jgi:cytoskeletal protein CcmA (bactofilin family)
MKNVMFFHGKTVDGTRFTVAGKFEKEGLIFKHDTLVLGISICGNEDLFVKKTGRIKSEGRLNSLHSHGKVIIENVNDNITDFIRVASTCTLMDSKQLKKDFNLYHNERK